MKNFKKSLLSLLAMIAFVLSANAQAYLEDPRYGSTPEERQANVLVLNYFNDAYAAKQYDLAAVHLKTLMGKAPKASQNLYINGANIYKSKISKAKSVAEKKALVDTLMTIYDFRAEHFGDNAKRGKAYILNNKAHDYLAYQPSERETIYKLFNEAIDVGGNDAEIDLLNNYFNILSEDYKQDLVETDFFLNEYERLAKIFETEPTPEKEDGKKVFDAILIASGAANCDNLEKLFKPKYAATPNDLELVTKIVGLMSRNGCNTEFQLAVTEQYYKLNPSPETALALAAIFEEKKDYDKSLSYLREAIAKESDANTKANHLVRAAGALIGNNNYRQAAELAKEAIGINPENGFAQYILAQAYAAGSSSACSEFNRQSAFWLVVDHLNSAKRLLADDAAQLESINKQIGTYTNYFPTNEECFFRSLNSGQGYQVNCGWISGGTTVRTVR